MASYIYEPLDQIKPTIRVVLLEAGSEAADIRCELQAEQLDSHPQYEALSYAWGDSKSLKNIHLHGHAHLVSSNLECALRHLRRPSEARVLWIDALCIDQGNLDEREQQVKLMRQIYSQAEMVISWLGEAGDESGEAIDLIRRFGPLARAFCYNEYPESISQLRETMHWRDFFNAVIGFCMEDQNWVALWKLLGRPYWYRVWMVQELVGAGFFEDVRGVIMCGAALVEKSLFDYTYFVIVTMTGKSNTYRPSGPVLDEPRRTFDAMGHPQGFVMAEIGMTCHLAVSFRKFGLDRLVKTTRRLQATDSRDMIYAIVGMAPEEYRGFSANYKEPVRHVLISFINFMIEVDQNLDSLLGNRFQMDRIEPSWTTELSQPEFGWIPGLYKFRAAGDTKPAIDINITDGSLSSKGVYVGRVTRTIGPDPLPGAIIGKQSRTQNDKHSSYTPEVSKFGESLKTAPEQEMFWRTLVLDHDFNDGSPIFPAPPEFAAMASVLFFGGTIPAEFNPQEPFQVRLPTFVHPFKKSWEPSRYNRCFFTMDNGHMGVGPFCMQTDDIVVMFYGAEFLLVLREIKSGYKLVGDAYVYGFMHGELAGDKDSADVKTFTLY